MNEVMIINDIGKVHVSVEMLVTGWAGLSVSVLFCALPLHMLERHVLKRRLYNDLVYVGLTTFLLPDDSIWPSSLPHSDYDSIALIRQQNIFDVL